MATLAEAFKEACSKFKLLGGGALDPERHEVHCGKKPVDLQTPFRLLNIPSSSSRLEVVAKCGSMTSCCMP